MYACPFSTESMPFLSLILYKILLSAVITLSTKCFVGFKPEGDVLPYFYT